MLSPAQVAQYQEKGFLNAGFAVPAGEVDRLRAELERVLQNAGGPGPQPVLCHNMSKNPAQPVWQIVNIWQASPAFQKLLENPVISGAAAQLCAARELRIWHDQIQYKPAGVGGVNMWHQDSPYWAVLREKDQQITAWIALDDVDASNGAMSMVPGSHRWGNQIAFLHTLKDFQAMPPEFQGHPTPVELCPVKMGHVHFHHSLTWHGSQANTSGRPRRAIALHFMNERTTYTAQGEHPMKPFIHVAEGQPIIGEAFPKVWENGATAGTAQGQHASADTHAATGGR